MTRPLRGKTVAVTGSRAAALEAQLSSAGARVLAIPLVRVEPPADGGAALRSALARSSQFEWIVVTSVNGVEALADVGEGPLPELAKWAAVGTATAAALSRLGRPPAVVPRRQDGVGLARALPEPVVGARALLVQGEPSSPECERELRARGWDVERVVGYRTAPTDLSSADTDRLASADVILLSSPSAAAHLARRGVDGVPCVCIGPVTAAAAEANGLPIVGVATEPSPEALSQAAITAVGLAG